ncbi:hypothetical protein CMT62_13020 [Elizabethkingia anophelis]|nr:hypothetical protein [Elizabethkingia anophelis]MDV3918028.1 hypothetical protein [Elizabethkingia anophelis]MDV3936141.1 hypothetical protein [Elizabethkingia anophelis]MDV3960873.1 hypothetical protein [Elizabethkingia anophelis]MDV3965361.1 hypothetical protein [Elizabethkingia anophelis]
MEGINNIVYQYGVGQTFQLVVIDSKHAGTYEIEEPDGFDDINSYIDINEEFFNVDNFILGESTSLEFVKYNNKDAYDIIDKVYKEKGGDGQIIFKWIVDGDDILGDDFQLNLNKVSYQYEKSSQKIVTEIKKRESQNKILSREDTSVNLFSDKNLDNKPISPVATKEIYFKEIRKNVKNFYSYSAENEEPSLVTKGAQRWQWLYRRNADFGLGDNTNEISGWHHQYQSDTGFWFAGDMLSTKSDIGEFKITISNLEFTGSKVNPSSHIPLHLVAILKDSTGTPFKFIILEKSKSIPSTPNTTRIEILTSKTYTNETLGTISDPAPLTLKAGQSIEISFMYGLTPDSEYDPNVDYVWRSIKTGTSITIESNLLNPLRKVPIVTLKDALNQICKSYSDDVVSVESTILGNGGIYENTGIGTGIQLRGISETYKLPNKLTTSLKDLLYDGVAPLFAFGYDIIGNKFIVENVDYFFKDIQVFDLSDKGFDEDGYVLSNDLENSFNNLKFGGKKYSTDKKNDIRNFNTALDGLTPIKSTKNKMDKTSNLLIDEFMIGSVINDNSSKTSDSDDDIILIDMVHIDNYKDNGIIFNCIHEIVNGHLSLKSYNTPFDMLPINIGDVVEITSGLNQGIWTVFAKTAITLELTGSTTIQTGVSNTPISYTVTNFTKNRSDEGFVSVDGVYSRDTTFNLRHNPKFQMARWSGFFGSALVKKLASEEILVTNYKNNGNVEIEVNPAELPNELSGRVKLNSNETVGRLRNFKYPYFTNQTIEITIPYVTFEEFFRLHNNWRFGIDGDRNKSRGYITVDTPEGVMDVYPFGQKGLEHNKGYNTLTIRGKVKGSSLKNKILNAVFTGPTIVQLQIFTPDEFKALPMRIKATKDNGATWETIYNGANSSNVQIDDAFFFTNIPKNRKIGFRVFSIEDGIEQYKSDDVFIPYPFGEIVVNTTKIITNPDESNCGYTYVEYEVIGEGVLEVHYKLFSEQGNGSIVVLDENDNIIVEIHAPVNAENYEHTEIVNLTLTGKSKFKATLRAASTVNEGFYTCFDNGNPFILMYATTGIRFFDNGKDFAGIGIAASGRKYRIN